MSSLPAASTAGGSATAALTLSAADFPRPSPLSSLHSRPTPRTDRPPPAAWRGPPRRRRQGAATVFDAGKASRAITGAGCNAAARRCKSPPSSSLSSAASKIAAAGPFNSGGSRRPLPDGGESPAATGGREPLGHLADRADQHQAALGWQLVGVAVQLPPQLPPRLSVGTRSVPTTFASASSRSSSVAVEGNVHAQHWPWARRRSWRLQRAGHWCQYVRTAPAKACRSASLPRTSFPSGRPPGPRGPVAADVRSSGARTGRETPGRPRSRRARVWPSANRAAAAATSAQRDEPSPSDPGTAAHRGTRSGRRRPAAGSRAGE